MGNDIRIIGVGDIMPGGILNMQDTPSADEAVNDLLRQADLRLGTLECALGNEPAYDEEKVADRGNVIYAKETDIRRVKELGIDVVSLANNHFFDLGYAGARRTIELLEANGIAYCGAGNNIEEACRPVIREIRGKRIAVLAFCDTTYTNVYWCTYAGSDEPGVCPMRRELVIEQISNAKQLADYVIVMPHWGCEHTFFPNSEVVEWSRLMTDAGADLILGSHPHRIQPIVRYKGVHTAFCMGNFLFPARLIAPPKVTYYPESKLDVSILPVTSDYPIVDTVTLKVLPYLGQIGMIVNATIGDVNDCRIQLTRLAEDNIIRRLPESECRRLQFKLSAIGMCIKYGLYRQLLWARRIWLGLSWRIKKVLDDNDR